MPSNCRSRVCQVDDCDGAHCPCCGGHKVDFYAPGHCDLCLDGLCMPEVPITCRNCGQDSSGCIYCNACAQKLPEYNYEQDDLNFDAAREKGR